MSTLRKISAIPVPGVEPNSIDSGQPSFLWVDPRTLFVEESYQRDLGEKSTRLIRRIVGGWDWKAMKPPVCARTDNGSLMVIDGQHTAIAASTHPGITEIPVMIVDANTIADRAQAFVSHNSDRIAMTPMQLHIAAIAAGDPVAIAMRGQATQTRSSAALKKILNDGGITIEWKMTPVMRDVLDATVNANVSLIKSIPSKYFMDVEGLVMRSVQTGRDLGGLTKDLQARYGITRRRAALIATDQNNKATSAMVRARQMEAGIEEAIWVHAGGPREPRPTHLKAGRDKVRYRIDEGWFDPAVGEHIQPGQLINCKCRGKPVIRGFT